MAGTHSCDQYLDRAACIRQMTAGAPTLLALADFVGFTGDGFTINLSTNSGANETLFFILFGDRVSVRIMGNTNIWAKTWIK